MRWRFKTLPTESKTTRRGLPESQPTSTDGNVLSAQLSTPLHSGQSSSSISKHLIRLFLFQMWGLYNLPCKTHHLSKKKKNYIWTPHLCSNNHTLFPFRKKAFRVFSLLVTCIHPHSRSRPAQDTDTSVFTYSPDLSHRFWSTCPCAQHFHLKANRAIKLFSPPVILTLDFSLYQGNYFLTT